MSEIEYFPIADVTWRDEIPKIKLHTRPDKTWAFGNLRNDHIVSESHALGSHYPKEFVNKLRHLNQKLAFPFQYSVYDAMAQYNGTHLLSGVQSGSRKFAWEQHFSNHLIYPFLQDNPDQFDLDAIDSIYKGDYYNFFDDVRIYIRGSAINTNDDCFSEEFAATFASLGRRNITPEYAIMLDQFGVFSALSVYAYQFSKNNSAVRSIPPISSIYPDMEFGQDYKMGSNPFKSYRVHCPGRFLVQEYIGANLVYNLHLSKHGAWFPDLYVPLIDNSGNYIADDDQRDICNAILDGYLS